MLAAVAKALDQMFTPPFRAVLAKSVGLAVALMVVLVIVLFRLLEWFSGSGLTWLEMTFGPWAHTPLAVLGWVIAFALGVGLLAGAILLMPAVTAVVASLFSDEISEIVEREHYPQDAPGRPLPMLVAAIEGTKIGLLSIVVYLVAAPFLLFAGIGVLLFFLASLLGPLSPNLAAFLAMQFLAGIGSGTFIPLTISFIILNLPARLVIYGIAAYAMNAELSSHAYTPKHGRARV